MKVKTYVINLAESVDRRKYMEEETAKYPFLDVEWVEAVNGKALTEEETERLFDRKGFARRYSRYSVPGEIGCTLSHRACYEALLASDEQAALILEDDMSFVCPEEVESILCKSIRLVERADTEIILFTQSACYYNKPEQITGKYTVFPVYGAYGTFAYLINRRGAEWLLRMNRPSIVADDYDYMRQKGMTVKCVIPSIAMECSCVRGLDSTLGNNRGMKTRVKLSLCMKIKKKIENSILAKYRDWAFKKGWLVNSGYYV